MPEKNKNVCFIGVLLLTCLLIIFSQPVWAMDTTQKIIYNSSYSLDNQKIDHTVTFKIDYLQEIINDIYLQGDLVIRTTNKNYADPFIMGPNELYLMPMIL